jgi:lipopolysaccharide heptosyltransferase II
MGTRTFHKILVVRNDRLGDWVLTLPLLDALKAAWPACRVDVMARPALEPLLGRYPAVGGYLAGASPTPGSIGAAAARVKAERYDAAVVVHPDLTDTLVVRCAGVPVRVGNGCRAYSFLYNRPVRFHRSPSDRHEVEYNLRYLAALGLAAPSPAPDPRLDVSAEDRAEAAALLAAAGVRGDYVVVHPGSGGSSLNWSPARYRALVTELARTTGWAVVVTGSAAEVDLAAGVAGSGPGRVSLAGRTPLGVLPGVLAGARLFISSNTGPMHVAAAVGTATLALFTPLRSGSPARWGPRTARARVLQPPALACARCPGEGCRHYNCMEAITVEEVLTAARRLAAAGGGGKVLF